MGDRSGTSRPRGASMLSKRNRLFLMMASALLGVPPSAPAQPAKQIKLAVVDLGAKNKAPAAFVDLLTVACSKQPALILLERDQVDRLHREQALSLSLSKPIQPETAVQAGKLWAVDAFLMLETDKGAKGPVRVRLRLVDAHHGMKVLDSNLLLEADGKRFPEQADALAKLTAQKLATFRKDAQGVRLIGVATIRSGEVSKSWDWLSEALAAGIEQHLGLEPAVILMERQRTRTLTDERLLAEGLPEALKASAVLVTGSFRLEREKGLNAISVQVQCRSAGKIILEQRVEGSLDQPGLLAQKLARQIAAGLVGKQTATRSMSPAEEAKLLADQARAFFGSGNWTYDPEQALAPAEAALALVPNSNEYRYLLLTILDSQLNIRMIEKGQTREGHWQDALTYCMRAIPAAERIVASPDKSLPMVWPATVTKVFTNHFVHHSIRVRDAKPGALEDDEAAQAVRKGLRALHAGGMALPGYQVHFVESAGKLGYTWCDTPEQALELLTKSLEASAAEFKRTPNSIVSSVIQGSPYLFHHFARCPQWAKRGDIERLYADHLDGLRRHKDPVVRLAGELHSVAFHSDAAGGRLDHDKTRKHFQSFLSTLTTEVQPQWPHGAMAYSSWVHLTLANGRFAEDGKKDAAIQADFLRETLDYFLADTSRFQILQYWISSLDAYARHLERLGKADEAYRYFQTHAQRLQKVKLFGFNDPDVLPNVMDNLARRHPELRAASGPNPYKAEPVLLVKDLARFFNKAPWSNGGVALRRVIHDGKVAALVCSHGVGRKERFGLLRLDPETLKPISFREYAVDFSTDSKWPIDEFSPAFVVAGTTVYIGSPYGGIVEFPLDGPARGWNEKTGLASDQIASLAVLDGKVYAATGAYYTDRGLIDLDVATGKSAIHFSSKAIDSSHVLDGRPILGVAADPKRGCLLVAVRPKPGKDGSMDRGALFAYYPKEQKTVKKMEAERGLEWLAPHGDKLLMGAVSYALSMDLQSEQISALINVDPPGYIPFKSPRNPRRFGGSRMLLPVGEQLLWVDRINPYTGSLSAMKAGDDRPTSIIEKCFTERPERHVIKDLALCPRGLLLLTWEGLYLSPGVSVGKGTPINANPR